MKSSENQILLVNKIEYLKNVIKFKILLIWNILIMSKKLSSIRYYQGEDLKCFQWYLFILLTRLTIKGEPSYPIDKSYVIVAVIVIRRFSDNIDCKSWESFNECNEILFSYNKNWSQILRNKHWRMSEPARTLNTQSEKTLDWCSSPFTLFLDVSALIKFNF